MSTPNRIASTFMVKGRQQRQKQAVAPIELAQKDVPLQVMVPAKVRRQLALLCAERGESMRTVVLRGLRNLGVEIDETELVDRRGRRRG
jgi:hypothetical protein